MVQPTVPYGAAYPGLRWPVYDEPFIGGGFGRPSGVGPTEVDNPRCTQRGLRQRRVGLVVPMHTTTHHLGSTPPTLSAFTLRRFTFSPSHFDLHLYTFQWPLRLPFLVGL